MRFDEEMADLFKSELDNDLRKGGKGDVRSIGNAANDGTGTKGGKGHNSKTPKRHGSAGKTGMATEVGNYAKGDDCSDDDMDKKVEQSMVNKADRVKKRMEEEGGRGGSYNPPAEPSARERSQAIQAKEHAAGPRNAAKVQTGAGYRKSITQNSGLVSYENTGFDEALAKSIEDGSISGGSNLVNQPVDGGQHPLRSFHNFPGSR
jgi:hypothetical protein